MNNMNNATEGTVVEGTQINTQKGEGTMENQINALGTQLEELAANMEAFKVKQSETNQTIVETKEEVKMTVVAETNKGVDVMVKEEARNKYRRTVSVGIDVSAINVFKKSNTGVLRQITIKEASKFVTMELVNGQMEKVLSNDIVFVASENANVKEMKTATKSIYQTMSESGTARVAADFKMTEFTVLNTRHEEVTFEAYDNRMLGIADFGSVLNNDFWTAFGIRHMFRTGFYTMKDGVNQVRTMDDIIQYVPMFDTPAQKRLGKATFFALELANQESQVALLKLMGHEILGYAKLKNGKYVLNAQKTGTRFGLDSSSSLPLTGWNEAFGTPVFEKDAEGRNIIEKDVHGNAVIRTTTGVSMLLCDDTTAEVMAASFVFCADRMKGAQANNSVTPVIETANNFMFRVNATDGSIYSDAKLFAPLLRKQKLGGTVRNGKMRGYAHQFRTQFQDKGLNVVLPYVKELTGYDIIFFDGARKTDLAHILASGRTMRYHVMLSASVFTEENKNMLSPQMINNLDLPREVLTGIAAENIKLAKEAINDKEKALEIYSINNTGKSAELTEEEAEQGMEGVQDLKVISDEQRRKLNEEFGIKRYLSVNSVIWEDAACKREVQGEVKEFVNSHKNGYLAVHAKNNYMVSDVYASLLAVADGTFTITPGKCVLGKRQVAVAMYKKDEEGKVIRSFYEGRIVSIRSPHVMHEETQVAEAVNVVEVAKQFDAKAEWTANVSAEVFYAAALEGGYLDGLTLFSSDDIMIPASSGADQDGDTSLIIIDERIVKFVTDSKQYMNYSMVEGKEYVVENHRLVGAMIDGELVTDSSVLEEGAVWSDPAEAPEFNLPKGITQVVKNGKRTFDIEIPAEMIETPEAYKAWTDAIQSTMEVSLKTSQIGRLSNIQMAVVNGLNFLAMGLQADPTNQLLVQEYAFFNRMKFVIGYAVWQEIDAAKHGGAYAEALENWLAWFQDEDSMVFELEQAHVNMKRIIGKTPKLRHNDGVVEEIETKFAVVLPDSLREAKYAAPVTPVHGAITTNLHMYGEDVKAMYENEQTILAEISEADYNIIPQMNAIVSTITDQAEYDSYVATFKSAVAMFQDDFYLGAPNPYNVKRNFTEKAGRRKKLFQQKMEDKFVNFSDMPVAKQNAIMKQQEVVAEGEQSYYDIKVGEKVAVTRIKNELRRYLIMNNIDVVKFTATSYVLSYQSEMGAKVVNGRNARAELPAYIFWRLLEDEMFLVLSHLEGAQLKYSAHPEQAHIDSIYMNAMAGTTLNKEYGALFIKNRFVFADVEMTQPIAYISGYSVYEFLNDVVYRVDSAVIDSKKGKLSQEITAAKFITKDVMFYGLRTSQPVTATAEQVYVDGMPEGEAVNALSGAEVVETVQAAATDYPMYDVTLFDGFTPATLQAQQGVRFLITRANGVSYIGMQVDGQAAVAVGTFNFESASVQEGDVFEVSFPAARIAGTGVQVALEVVAKVVTK